MPCVIQGYTVSMRLDSLGVTSEKRGNVLFYKLVKQWTPLVCHTNVLSAYDIVFHCIVYVIPHIIAELNIHYGYQTNILRDVQIIQVMVKSPTNNYR